MSANTEPKQPRRDRCMADIFAGRDPVSLTLAEQDDVIIRAAEMARRMAMETLGISTAAQEVQGDE